MAKVQFNINNEAKAAIHSYRILHSLKNQSVALEAIITEWEQCKQLKAIDSDTTDIIFNSNLKELQAIERGESEGMMTEGFNRQLAFVSKPCKTTDESMICAEIAQKGAQ